MSSGSWILDDVRRHLTNCAQCHRADPENCRLQHNRLDPVSKNDVPTEALTAMCPDGRAIYRSFLRWLKEPDD